MTLTFSFSYNFFFNLIFSSHLCLQPPSPRISWIWLPKDLPCAILPNQEQLFLWTFLFVKSWTAWTGKALRHHLVKRPHFTGVEIECKGALGHTGFMTHNLHLFYFIRPSSTSSASTQNCPERFLYAPYCLLVMTERKCSEKNSNRCAFSAIDCHSELNSVNSVNLTE